MEVGNDIVIQNGTQWSFGNGVAEYVDEYVTPSFFQAEDGIRDIPP